MPASVVARSRRKNSLSRHDIRVNVSARDLTRPRLHDDFALPRFFRR
jgi:hypothetical protein